MTSPREPETEGLTDAPREALLRAQNQREQGRLGTSVVLAVPEHQGPHLGVRHSWAVEAWLDPLGLHRINSIVRSNKTEGKPTGDEGPSPQHRWESPSAPASHRRGGDPAWRLSGHIHGAGPNWEKIVCVCVYPQENVAEL